MKNTFAAVFFVFLAFQLSAQIPGYIGNRVFLGYRCGVSPAIDHKEGQKFGVSIHNALSIDFAISRKTIFYVQGEAALSQAKFNFIELFNVYKNPAYPNAYTRLSFHDETINTYGYEKTLNWGGNVGFKFYTKNYVAPVGRFIKIGFGILNIGLLHFRKGVQGTIQYETPFSPTGRSELEEITIKTEKQFYMQPYFNLGFGKTYAISDRLIMDIGLDFRLFPFSRYKWNYPGTVISNLDDFIFNKIWNTEYISRSGQFTMSLHYAL